MGTFKKEKGKVIMNTSMGCGLSVQVHRRTDPRIVKMFSDALARAKEKQNEVHTTEK